MGNMESIGKALVGIFWLACIAVPFALWKLGEIVVWIFRHLHWG